jgi:hypothetical protein
MFLRRPLSNDVAVIEADTSDDSPGARQNAGGVLANLPRTRPQRASARRTAARASSGSQQAASNGAVKPSRAKRSSRKAPAKAPTATTRKRAASTAEKPTVKGITESSASATAKAPKAGRAKAATSIKRGPAPHRAASRKARQAPPEEPAPRQGFESDGESAGGSIQPPGGTELVAAAAEIVGELARAGLSRSESLFKDVLSRLPL